MRIIKGGVAGIVALLILTGCTAVDPVGASDSVQTTFNDVRVRMSDLGSDYLRDGRIISPGNVARIERGANRDHVQSLIGTPLPYSAPHHWFYDINLPLSDMDDYLVCQLRVDFDATEAVSGVEWRRRQCQDRFHELTRTEPQHLSLSSDILFGYDSADLTPAGRQELDTAARVIAQNLQLDRVQIVGHTDRIGSVDYNRKLSTLRANSVRAYLVSRNVPSRSISTEGRGSSEPLVDCRGERVTQSLKDCLRPNRRVHLTIHGTR